MAEYTQEALARLDAQIATYQERLREARLSLGAGAEDGNNTWHDNPAFEEAKRNVDTWQAELRKLQEMRRNAVVVQPTGSTEVVAIGSFVTVRYDGEEEQTKLHLSGEHVVSRTRSEVMEISSRSPLGEAILNRKTGEHVTFRTPRGTTQGVTILTVT